jgi:hypothetical protein
MPRQVNEREFMALCRNAIVFSLSLLLTAGALAQSVIKPTGNAQRFPKADKKLAEQTKPASSQWLLDANDDTERFRRLQIMFSGTETLMWEISHRFDALFVAIEKKNWEMGVYQWEKIRDKMNHAAMKRPVRTQNLESKFLENGVWQNMHDALYSKDFDRIKPEFMLVRKACMECHIAENVGFLNDSPVFARTEAFSGAAK